MDPSWESGSLVEWLVRARVIGPPKAGGGAISAECKLAERMLRRCSENGNV
ncbi:MAG: hypothetical protein ACYC6L_15180 [Anaerolineae bacterium]